MTPPAAETRHLVSGDSQRKITASPSHQRIGRREPLHITDLGQQPPCGDRADSRDAFEQTDCLRPKDPTRATAVLRLPQLFLDQLPRILGPLLRFVRVRVQLRQWLKQHLRRGKLREARLRFRRKHFLAREQILDVGPHRCARQTAKTRQTHPELQQLRVQGLGPQANQAGVPLVVPK